MLKNLFLGMSFLLSSVGFADSLQIRSNENQVLPSESHDRLILEFEKQIERHKGMSLEEIKEELSSQLIAKKKIFEDEIRVQLVGIEDNEQKAEIQKALEKTLKDFDSEFQRVLDIEDRDIFILLEQKMLEDLNKSVYLTLLTLVRVTGMFGSTPPLQDKILFSSLLPLAVVGDIILSPVYLVNYIVDQVQKSK